jgi:hypothetical protein
MNPSNQHFDSLFYQLNANHQEGECKQLDRIFLLARPTDLAVENGVTPFTSSVVLNSYAFH